MISFNSSAGGRAQPIRFMVAIYNLPIVLSVLSGEDTYRLLPKQQWSLAWIFCHRPCRTPFF
jgi:hypothetical protein